MNPQYILDQALKQESSVRIKARDLYDCLIDPFTLWCKHFAPAEEQDPPSEYQELLMEEGNRHEEKVISTAMPNALTLSYTTTEEGFSKIIEAMSQGVDIIHNAPLIWYPEGLVGIADILEKKKGKSIFGDYHYQVKEIKLAKNIKPQHQIQACLYNYILGKIQGFTPNNYFIINRDMENLEYNYDEDWLQCTIDNVREILNKEKIPSPSYGNGIWPWESYADKKAEESRNISLAAGVGHKTKETLMRSGYETIDDLAKANTDDLKLIKGLGEATAAKMVRSAKAIVSGSPIKIKDYTLPNSDIEIFLDLEGTGQGTGEDILYIDYLIGLLVRKDGKEEFKPFVAHSLDGEGEMFKSFVDYLKTLENFMLYHWHHYEKTHIRNMCLKYCSEEDWKFIESHMIDLFPIATNSWAFPTYGNSLKKIAPFMGFEWRHEEVNAMESMAFYFEYIEDPIKNKDKLDKVLDYNEDDVIATRVVFDWLKSHMEK